MELAGKIVLKPFITFIAIGLASLFSWGSLPKAELRNTYKK
jgi:hypothetical protein